MADEPDAAELRDLSERLNRVAADSRPLAKLASVRLKLSEEIRAMAARA